MIGYFIGILLQIFLWFAVFHLLIYAFSHILKSGKKKKKHKYLYSFFDQVNEKMIVFWKYIGGLIMFLLPVFISAFLGMGIVDLIYQMNTSLGYGYAVWASYVIAILVYLLISSNLNFKTGGKQNGKPKRKSTKL